MGVKLGRQKNYKPGTKELASISYFIDVNIRGRRPKEWYPAGAIREDLSPAEKRAATDALKKWYAKRQNEILNDVLDLPLTYQTHLSVADQVDEYIAAYTASDRGAMRAALNKYKAYLPARMLFAQVTEAHLQGFIDWMAEKELSSKSIVIYWTQVKVMMEAMCRQGYCRLQMDRLTIDLPSIVMAETEWLAFAELQQLMRYECPDPRVRRAFIFMSYTGQDLGNTLTMEPRHIQPTDIKGQRVGLLVRDRKKLQIDSKIVKADKKKHKEAVKALHPLALEMAEQAMAEPWGKYIFDVPGRGTTLPNITQLFNDTLQQWVDAAGIKKKITSRSGRHFFATHVKGKTSYSLTDHSEKSGAGKVYRHELIEDMIKDLAALPAVEVK